METLDETDIRASFVNCSKSEMKRINLPKPLSDQPWADLDFLGWRDPGAPDRGYIVVEHGGRLVGVTLRAPQGVRRSFTKTTVCSLCVTTHPGTGVSLLAAPRAGAAGRQGNTVGAYMCADLACSLYVRGRKETGLGARFEEDLPLQAKIDRTLVNLASFVDRVLDS
ncbi:FBP domain-containing protein [Actinoallomurus oryzae]|uniref:FBP domain-containing protein n=1 Tax=Actinoallomurus oryzae TaxID=502180 RepID=A0ABP8QY86_9ACTN